MGMGSAFVQVLLLCGVSCPGRVFFKFNLLFRMCGISSLVVEVWLADKADKRDVVTGSGPRPTGRSSIPRGSDRARIEMQQWYL